MRKIFLAAAILISAQVAFAQIQNPDSPEFDLGYPETDSADMSTDEYENDSEQAPEAEPQKPYERIVLDFDSITNLITYTDVIEQEDSGSDSLYLRTKKWIAKTFPSGTKYEVDKKNQKIVFNGSLDAYSYANKYSKKRIGSYQFKITILYKEGRYKYTISNLVHEGPKPASGAPKRNYFEYYYTTTTNIKGTDQILRYADKDITNMIEELKKALAEPIIIDEDDW